MTEAERELDLMLGDALTENERLRKRLQYQEDRDGWIGTHGPECYTYGPRHYECALRRIKELERAET